MSQKAEYLQFSLPGFRPPTQQEAVEAVVFNGFDYATLPDVYGGRTAVVLSEQEYANLIRKAYGPRAYVGEGC